MSLRSAFLFLSAAFFTCFVLRPTPCIAQSFYFSVGTNKASYSPSTIHVSQSELGNSYDLVHVKADNKTHAPFSIYQLNYRLGYYCNYEQTLGIEFNYDPVNYHVKDGQNVTLSGMVNGIPKVNRTINFSAKNGYLYKYDGANLMLLNIVKRIDVYHTNNKKIRVDAILKGGVGPVMPHVQNSLPLDAFDNPQLEWGGWNAGFETAVRVSIYKYGFVEVAGKYDYAEFSGINTYQGTTSQKLSTYEGIASIGVAIPTRKHNPLFYAQTIVTIIPVFVDKKDKEDKQNAKDSTLTSDFPALTDIPEFSEIADRDEKHKSRDSLAQAMRTYYDSVTANERKKDSIMTREMNDSLNTPAKAPANEPAANKGGSINVDSLENKLMQQGNAAPAPPVVQPTMSKKDLKRLEKQQKKDKKKLEKQQEEDKQKKDAEEKAAKEKEDGPKTDNADKKETSTEEKKADTPPPAETEKKEAPADIPPSADPDKK